MKKTLLTFIMLLFVAVSFGQQGANRGPFISNNLSDNWFISAGGGLNLYFGEYDNRLAIQNRFSPALDISLGRWITPYIGVRLQYAGLRANGKVFYFPGDKPFVSSTAVENDWANEKFNTLNLHADLLWNLSNCLGGYRADRTWDIVPFIGFGWARSSNIKSWNAAKLVHNEPSVNLGFINKIRLSNVLDLNVEVRHMIVSDAFDGIVRGSKWEGMSSATLGLSVKISNKEFDRYVKVEPADYTPYNNRIAALERDIAERDANAKRLQDDLANERARYAEAANREPEYFIQPLAVFFQIGKADLTDKEIINLGYAADIIKKSGKSFKIQGSADSATGSKKRNQLLSEMRANKVYEVLVNKFGVNPSQLQVIAKGDNNEPFGKPVLNRVVILEN